MTERRLDYYYVTGASRGIGRAIVERLLEEDAARIIGIARGEGVTSPRYRHVKLDLSDLAAVGAFRFEAPEDARRVILVNNAALHEPKQMGNFDSAKMASMFALNAVTPAILMNSFLAAYRDSPVEQMVVCNISSAINNVPGGGVYCASKAALDMTTRVAFREANEAGNTHVRFILVDPGGVDTDMQVELRASTPEDLPIVEGLRSNKENGLLTPPEEVAALLCPVLIDPSIHSDLYWSCRRTPSH